jgi:hypothetical protein
MKWTRISLSRVHLALVAVISFPRFAVNSSCLCLHVPHNRRSGDLALSPGAALFVSGGNHVLIVEMTSLIKQVYMKLSIKVTN